MISKPRTIPLIAVLFPIFCIAQGFPPTSINWSLPSGGQMYNGVNQGFCTLADYGNDTGSDTWSTLDLNGDGKVDLVCTGTRNAQGYVTEFSPASNSYWKVYLNTGSGFNTSFTSWPLPAGGQVYNGVNQGFCTLADYGNDTGSDTWSTIDMNGDAKPDLVCTGTRNAQGYVTEFSPASNSYWKVYLNTGSGFSTSFTSWLLPAGGQVYNGVNQGFCTLADYGNDTGSDTWSTIDINGDAKPDLVCTGTRNAQGYVTEFSPASNSYWKAYLNTGSGFNTSFATWPLPAGGQVYNGVNQGFCTLADYGNDTGSDTWSTIDINGDAKPDLVCTGTRNAQGYVTEFSPASNSYWKAYLNTGSGFNTSFATWPLPAGGQVYNGVNQGFCTLADYGNDSGSDTWSTVDLNADGRPDLVCTGTRNANGYVTEFSPANNSYWKMYVNTGSGFATSFTSWSLPAGGQVYNGVNQGFCTLADYGNDTGSDTWSTLDINGDGRLDLVCTGTRNANGYVTEFSPASNSYWKVYLQDNASTFLEELAEDRWSIFPNPASEAITIVGDARLGTITLCDAQGRLVRSAVSLADRYVLEVADLPRGVYLIRLNEAAARRVVLY